MPQFTGSVLIVDDEQNNIFSLKATLKTRGYDCYTANDARQALDILHTQGKIGIVLIDLMMPDMDGQEFIHILRQHETLKSIPVIVVTAKAMRGDKEKILAATEADGYIAKPIDVDVLLGYLHTYLNQY